MKHYSNTERKLAEAKFFLDQLNPNKPYFDFYLSAYLNSARSTSWIMRNEFEKVEGWSQWFEGVILDFNEKSLLKRINELRIESVKISGIKTEYKLLDHLIVDEEYYASIENALEKFYGEQVEIEISLLGDVSQKADVSSEALYFQGRVEIQDPSSENVREVLLKMCHDYYLFLRNQVLVCILKFGNHIEASISLSDPTIDPIT